MPLRALLLLSVAALLVGATPYASASMADASEPGSVERVMEAEMNEAEATVAAHVGAVPSARVRLDVAVSAARAMERSAPTLRPPRP